MILFITQFAFMGGCSQELEDSGEGPAAYSRLATWEDDSPGTAFGSALAADSSGVWIGVPEDAYGRIDRLVSGQRHEVYSPGERSGLGHSVAWDPNLGLAFGAPLAHEGEGRLLGEDGLELQSGSDGQRLGSASIPSDAGWIVGGNEVIIGPGFELSPPGRPRSLAVFEDRIVAGLAQIRDGVWTEDGILHTADSASLAGFSLCVADVDKDDHDELVIGAPGINQVYVLNSLPESGVLEEGAVQYGGEGYFGWSLGCRYGEIWIGAPLYDDAQTGAVYRVSAGDPEGEMSKPWLSGEGWGSQMGFALALSEDGVWIGSPGGPGSIGRVDCAY